MFTDSRFNLLRCSDDEFVRFLRESIHPSVCSDSEEQDRLKQIYAKYLSIDGYELYVEEIISQMPIYSFRERQLGADMEDKKEKSKHILTPTM